MILIVKENMPTCTLPPEKMKVLIDTIDDRDLESNIKMLVQTVFEAGMLHERDKK